MKNKEQITRKDALKKIGSYAAVTALGTMVLLSPKASQAGSQSPAPPKRKTPPPPKKEDEGILSI